MTKVAAAVLFPIPDPLLYSKKKLLESFKSILLQSDLPEEIILINCSADKLIANELEQIAKTSGTSGSAISGGGCGVPRSGCFELPAGRRRGPRNLAAEHRVKFF